MPPIAKTATRNTYRLSELVDDWLNAEAERLGISKNAVLEMKLRLLKIHEEQERDARIMREAKNDGPF